MYVYIYICIYNQKIENALLESNSPGNVVTRASPIFLRATCVC